MFKIYKPENIILIFMSSVILSMALLIFLSLENDILNIDTSRGIYLLALVLSLFLAISLGGWRTYIYVKNFFTLVNTERHQEKEDLISHSSTIRSLLEFPQLASIFSLDKNFCYTHFNSKHKREMETVFGPNIDRGVSVIGLVPEPYGSRFQQHFNRALAGEYFSITGTLLENYYSLLFSPIYGENDSVTGLSCSIYDITEKIKAEQELNKYKEHLEELVVQRTKELDHQRIFFQKIIDGLQSHIFVRDLDHKYILINESMAQSFRDGSESLLGKTPFQDKPNQEDTKRVLEEDKKVINTSISHHAVVSYQLQNESVRWFEIHKSLLEVGSEKYLLGHQHDITSHKELTLALEKSNLDLSQTLEKLKVTQMLLIESEKMASVGQLTSGLAHEINNPINFVAGNVSPIKRDLNEIQELLQQVNISEEKSEEFAELFNELDALLKGITDGCYQVNELMRDLKTFAVPEVASMMMANPKDVLLSTVNLVKFNLKDRIEIKLDSTNLPNIKCHPGKLSQVFLNLINNAQQSISDKGAITIRCSQSEDSVTLEFSDDGHGIPKDLQSKIFEPFFTTRPVGKGTGLGLAICYAIINDHNGSIKVDSTEGKGATFTVQLPKFSIDHV
ncbi:MAG: PAS domain S-box-containing protein [Marinoscillum sp.]|jgi:PAS domain S-box-containing protein